jgi:hypothetical protein
MLDIATLLIEETVNAAIFIVDADMVDPISVETVRVPPKVVPCTASFVSVSYIMMLGPLALRMGATYNAFVDRPDRACPDALITILLGGCD